MYYNWLNKNLHFRLITYCYLIFSVIILKVKAPVGLLFTKHKDQLFVPSVPLTPREIVYIHPFLSIDWIEIIMYSSAFTPKSYVSFPDSAVITLLTDSIIGILLFYDGFTDSLDGGQLIVLHDALSILLFESAIDLM